MSFMGFSSKILLNHKTVETARFESLRLFVLIALIVAPPILILYGYFEITELVVALIFYYISCLWIFWRIKSSDISTKYSRFFLIITIYLIIYAHYLGNEEFDNKPWIILTPILIFSLLGAREGICWIVGVFCTLVAVYITKTSEYNLFSIIIQFTALATTAYVFCTFIRHSEKNIKKITEMLEMDELTGAFNRRQFNKNYDLEYRRLQRGQRSLAILMIDIDHFKEFNDTYGHQKGDDVLAQVAQALIKSARRAGDNVYRYGGEEFCILLPEIERDSTAYYAESACQSIRDLQIPNISISIGFKYCQEGETHSAHELLKMADKALYFAKRNGRDQVVDAESLSDEE